MLQYIFAGPKEPFSVFLRYVDLGDVSLPERGRGDVIRDGHAIGPFRKSFEAQQDVRADEKRRPDPVAERGEVPALIRDDLRHALDLFARDLEGAGRLAEDE